MKYPIEEITWIDASSLGIGWCNIKDTIKEAKQTYKSPVSTIGYIIKERKNYLVLSMSVGLDDDVNNSFMLPKKFILKRRRIENGKV